jgi:hypothetical protein
MQRKRNCGIRPETTTYEIRVEGQLSDQWSAWFEGFAIRQILNSENSTAITILSGCVTDQAALHGILEKIRNLNLKLLSVQAVG